MSGFLRLLNEFRYDDPIKARSSYSEFLDVSMEIADSLPDISLLTNILFYVVIVLVILSVLLISKFVFSKDDLRKLKNQRAKKICAEKMVLWNSVPIVVHSMVLSLIILIFFTNFFRTILMDGEDVILIPFVLGLRQLVVLFLSVIGIGIISYLISIIKISKII